MYRDDLSMQFVENERAPRQGTNKANRRDVPESNSLTCKGFWFPCTGERLDGIE